MGRFLGEEKLLQNAKQEVLKGIEKITDEVYFMGGYSSSNAIVIEGTQQLIFVDAFYGKEVAEEALVDLRKITNKPITHLIYTHYFHPDHTGGAGAIVSPQCHIIGYKPQIQPFGKSEMVQKIAGRRGMRQFGAGLNIEEMISMGVGCAEMRQLTMDAVMPNQLFSESKKELNIDGIHFYLYAAPGETDDQLFVWLPEQKVLCCGDNYYASFPNLYAIRGGQYRDINGWITSLDAMIALNAEYLLPGHGKAVIGRENVYQTLSTYREALNFVLEATLCGMNEGKTIEQLVEQVQLPQHLIELPHLQEYYGTVAWSVRAIYTAYLGWFDGNPTKLGFMPPKVRGEKQLAMMGGAQKVIQAVEEALSAQEEQWAVELCDILLDAQQCVEQATALKAQGLIQLGRLQTSANGRHYYLVYAKELMEQLK